MNESFPTVRVAAIQAAPVLFDRDATIAKMTDLVADAAAQGAQVAVLPEAFIPAYPRGFSFGAVVGSRTDSGRDLFARYWSACVDVPSAATDAIAAIARRNSVYLVVGVVERDGEFGGGTLYCTLLYYGPDGAYLGKHRKLKPTGSERLIWGEGDGSTLTTFDTEWGRAGGLICWENYMPLARAAMYAKGVHIYFAPTADCRDTWQSTLQHVAVEGRCFVIGCNQYVHRSMVPTELPDAHEIAALPEEVCRGGSAIYGPLGDVLAGPLYGEEGTLVADLDMREIARSRYDFDPSGHYARPDIFRLEVDERPRRPAVEAAPRVGSESSTKPDGDCC
jgi:nitrilase